MPADYDNLPTTSGFNKKHMKKFLLFINPVISMENGELKNRFCS